MTRALLTTVLVVAPAAWACAGAVYCRPALPPAGRPLPVNAPALVGLVDPFAEDAGVLVATYADGGTETLARIAEKQVGEGENYAFFAPPARWAVGESLTLTTEGFSEDCTRTTVSTTSFSVAPAAPFPTELGTLVVGAEVGFSNTDPRAPTNSCSSAPINKPGVTRELSLDVTPEALQWLSVARIRRDAARPWWGHLGGLNARVPMGVVSVECERRDVKKSVPVSFTFEIPGRAQTVTLNQDVEFDCANAGPQVGCSAAPASLLAGALVLLLRRRRRVSSSRSSYASGHDDHLHVSFR